MSGLYRAADDAVCLLRHTRAGIWASRELQQQAQNNQRYDAAQESHSLF
jgi:hypothetical protein